MTTSKRTRKKFGKQRSFDWSLWDIELGRVLRNGKLKKARKSYLCFARSFAFIYKAEEWERKEEHGCSYANSFPRE